MATYRLAVQFSGDLQLQQSAGCSGASDAGAVYVLRLTSPSLQGEQQVGQKLGTLDSLTPVALPWPSGLEAKVVYFRGLGERDLWSLTVSYTSGDVVIPATGLVMLEAQADDLITGVALAGTGSFEWAAWG